MYGLFICIGRSIKTLSLYRNIRNRDKKSRPANYAFADPTTTADLFHFLHLNLGVLYPVFALRFYIKRRILLERCRVPHPHSVAFPKWQHAARIRTVCLPLSTLPTYSRLHLLHVPSHTLMSMSALTSCCHSPHIGQRHLSQGQPSTQCNSHSNLYPHSDPPSRLHTQLHLHGSHHIFANQHPNHHQK